MPSSRSAAAAAMHAPRGIGGLLALQQTVGNRAVVQMTRDAAKPRTKRFIPASRRKPGPRKAKWLRELEAQQAAERQAEAQRAQQQRDRLTAQGAKDLLTDRIRAGIGGHGGIQEQLGLGADLRGLFQQALPEASQSYTGFAQGHKHAAKFLAAHQIAAPATIETHAGQLAADPQILSEDAQEHLEEYERGYPAKLSAHQRGELPAAPMTPQEFLADRHRRSRIRTAGVWAEHASALLAIKQGAAGAHDADADADEGRDLTGRLGYLLMTTEAADLFSGITGGADPKEGVPRRQGRPKLAIDLADVFSTAACHKDADQVLHLMAGALIAKGVQPIRDEAESRALQAKILGAVNGSKASTKVLKLTNKSTHSIAFLIGDKATRLETIAGQNSETIAYNTLIHYKVRAVELAGELSAGFSKVLKFGQAEAFEWDLYTGTDLPTLTRRVDQHLAAGVTALRAGLAIGDVERHQEHGGAAPRLDALSLPLAELNTEAHAQVLVMDKAQPISKRKLVPQTSYRVQYRGKWMKATYLGPDEEAPAWMRPAARFKIVEVRASYQNPVADERTITLQQFATEIGLGGHLRELMDTANLTGQTLGVAKKLYVVFDPGNVPSKLRSLKVRKA